MSSNGRLQKNDLVAITSAPKSRMETPAKVPALWGTITDIQGDYVTVAFMDGTHWLPGATFLSKELKVVRHASEPLSA